MADFTNNLLSVVIILSSMFVTIGVMYARSKDGRLNFLSWIETNPIEQAERLALFLREGISQWLTKATGTPVSSTPVLVFPGWYVTSQSKPPFPHLCYKELNHKQLVDTIPTLRTQAFTQQQVEQIIYQVAQRCLSKREVRE
ncbi:hypothetical protein MZ018_01860 [Shewanella sp. JNE10-2]|uniref:hypothetical protein n=1 Tax=unclassified Shewanella TaxID=196818 RepID=UPI0020048207|nr:MULTISPECIES: hypothetical protein [unclassified Shewanella]MCK7629066.1 hypothetical protein [Shewanella sp. JNE9-1]MCK7633855.1 hypothetical protein [Shewanella sp. JNE17]MCK7644474.1 hypothetical protein [Shewanella sp. JNE3-1]MCK7649078.1 hypothetical protein [Shewanella sp. JNE8]MCK7652369.1 hypothetical protein [Shewanella sp. JNE4-1]